MRDSRPLRRFRLLQLPKILLREKIAQAGLVFVLALRSLYPHDFEVAAVLPEVKCDSVAHFEFAPKTADPDAAVRDIKGVRQFMEGTTGGIPAADADRQDTPCARLRSAFHATEARGRSRLP